MDCVLVMGIPASGKTRLAEYLSEKLDFPVISKDRVKELLFDTVGFRSREEKVALGVAAMEACYYFVEQMMKRGKPFLLENNFENSSRPGMEALLEKYQCRAVSVVLTGDHAAIYRRFLERDRSPDRHRGHVVNTCYPEPTGEKPPYTPITLEQFVSSIKSRGMEDFDLGGPRIVVDTTDFSKVNYEEILREVKKALRT